MFPQFFGAIFVLEERPPTHMESKKYAVDPPWVRGHAGKYFGVLKYALRVVPTRYTFLQYLALQRGPGILRLGPLSPKMANNKATRSRFARLLAGSQVGLGALDRPKFGPRGVYLGTTSSARVKMGNLALSKSGVDVKIGCRCLNVKQIGPSPPPPSTSRFC